jgi:hypothetical protein
LEILLNQNFRLGKGFGCRPGASGIPGKRAGVRKPPKNEPAEKR